MEPEANSLLQQNLTELGYKWKGCSDNVIHGRRWGWTKSGVYVFGYFGVELAMSGAMQNGGPVLCKQ